MIEIFISLSEIILLLSYCILPESAPSLMKDEVFIIHEGESLRHDSIQIKKE